MQDLSHGVIRVDSEEKLSVLTLQDVGFVMPGGEFPIVTSRHLGTLTHPVLSIALLTSETLLSVCSPDVRSEAGGSPSALQGR